MSSQIEESAEQANPLEGNGYGLTESSTELTERKRDEAAARRLAAIVDSSDDAIVGKDLNGIIHSWNKGAERIFGYREEEVVGKPITIIIPPERHDEEKRILERIRGGERVDHFETVRQRKDGTRLEISLTISPIRESSGRIIGASKIARDITERKQAERQQLALYELVMAVNRALATPDIFEAALDAVCKCQNADRASILLYDGDEVMRFKAWRGLSQSYREAVEGHSPWRRDDPDPQPVWIEDLRRAELDEHLRAVILAEGIQALLFVPLMSEKRLLGKFMVYYEHPHRFSPEELRCAQTIASQVVFAMERRKSSEELERVVSERTASLREAIAQMEEFSYSVSHDLRSPVRAMKGYAETLQEDYGDRLDGTAMEYLRRIIRSSTRMERLIQDVLTYSRISRTQMQLQPVRLDPLLQDIMRQYPELEPAKADFIIQPNLPTVLGHEASLTQAVGNLLINAVKFARPGVRSEVRIFAEKHGAWVKLLIQDNGIGIALEHQRRLFSMFERVHPEGKYEGTGIGLAIVRRAVERMGGKVGVESDGTQGSLFWLELKAA